MERYQYSAETRAALEGLKQPLAVYQFIGGQPVTLLLSDGFCDLYAFEDRQQAMRFMEYGMYNNLHPEDRIPLSDAAVHFFQDIQATLDVTFRIRISGSADYRVLHAQGKHVRTESGAHLVHVWYMDEGVEGDSAETAPVRSAEQAADEEKRILDAAHYDELTGLPTLTWFFRRCEIWRARVSGDGKESVLLYTDLNGMKLFNHKYGFAEGDKLLMAFAAELTQIFGKENCCHVDGDHFGVFTTEDMLEEQLQQLFRNAEKMNGGRTLPVRVGVYSSSIENIPVSAAYDRAKMACWAIAKSDHSVVNCYSRELLNAVKRQQHIVTNINRAIAEGWIKVYYQPIVRAVNEKICDEEALARWIDPEEGFLSPAEVIPDLEDAGLIYKLDLCVLDQVLEKLHGQQKIGVDTKPHSINLSRSDFDACDIVEEIRKRVDAAKVPHDRISIEITETTLASDFDFMKEQIARFRELGFPVWIDDFGSGYSSFDVLLSIPFDLVKLDMSFMRKLSENEGTRVILTELIKTTAALGIDTVCEGVETEEQARFLQEIGCSKLQGFYYSKPLPLEQIIQRYNAGLRIGFEDSQTAAYFETIGRVNLYDLSVIASRENDTLRKAFDMVPMGIIEIRGQSARFVRSNPSYREFMQRFFGIDLATAPPDVVPYHSDFMRSLVRACEEQGILSFYNEKLPDGTMVHSFARRIAVNPVNGDMAVVVAVLSVSEPGKGDSERLESVLKEQRTMARMMAVSEDYLSLYAVDPGTTQYVEYTASPEYEKLGIAKEGEDFFLDSVENSKKLIYPEDLEEFLPAFTREKVLEAISKQGKFTLTYRLLIDGKLQPIFLKIISFHDGKTPRLLASVRKWSRRSGQPA